MWTGGRGKGTRVQVVILPQVLILSGRQSTQSAAAPERLCKRRKRSSLTDRDGYLKQIVKRIKGRHRSEGQAFVFCARLQHGSRPAFDGSA